MHLQTYRQNLTIQKRGEFKCDNYKSFIIDIFTFLSLITTLTWTVLMWLNRCSFRSNIFLANVTLKWLTIFMDTFHMLL